MYLEIMQIGHHLLKSEVLISRASRSHLTNGYPEIRDLHKKKSRFLARLLPLEQPKQLHRASKKFRNPVLI